MKTTSNGWTTLSTRLGNLLDWRNTLDKARFSTGNRRAPGHVAARGRKQGCGSGGGDGLTRSRVTARRAWRQRIPAG